MKRFETDQFNYVDIDFNPGPNYKGDISIVTDKEAIKQSLISIFNTPKGSRLMLPGFGCDVHGFLFEPYDETTARLIAEEIEQSFEIYEPRISIVKINVNMNFKDVDSHMYKVEVLYKIRETRENDSLTLELEKL